MMTWQQILEMVAEHGHLPLTVVAVAAAAITVATWVAGVRSWRSGRRKRSQADSVRPGELWQRRAESRKAKAMARLNPPTTAFFSTDKALSREQAAEIEAYMAETLGFSDGDPVPSWSPIRWDGPEDWIIFPVKAEAPKEICRVTPDGTFEWGPGAPRPPRESKTATEVRAEGAAFERREGQVQQVALDLRSKVTH